MLRVLLPALAGALLSLAPAAAARAPVFVLQESARHEPVDWETLSRIREEGLERSQVMETLWHLTDLYGPRLTNSPQERRASLWAKRRLEEFGLENAALEPWGEFGLGWSFERCQVELLQPDYAPFIALPKAWTLGTGGPVAGAPLLVDAAEEEELESWRGQLSGRIVLFGGVREVPSPFEAHAQRHDEESLAELLEAPVPDGDGFSAGSSSSRWEDYRRRRAVREKLLELMREEGAAVLVEPDGGRRNDYGVIMIGSGGSRDPEEERGLPQVVLATEAFNRVARLLGRGEPVRMRVDVATTFYDDDLEGYNVVAEIPGNDPEVGDEIVMLGGHFDSWHAATGATDNGASCAVVMEAVRILTALGLEPRRTVRVALWTGEEQGLHGSEGYVEKHFAERETMELRPEHEKLSAYFNLDNGAGKIRGIFLQGNLACRPIFEAWFEPFHDLGAETVSVRDAGGTDHLRFDAVGLPGFQFIQDPMDYGSRTHHTNADTFERVRPADARQAAVVLASFAWHAAQRDEKLPRKPLPEPREQRPQQ